ncbi:MAG: PAS domain S-box protein [Chlorobi bacterium]|nr:PAS domain S-box protein [Chlorobiota bacterium]
MDFTDLSKKELLGLVRELELKLGNSAVQKPSTENKHSEFFDNAPDMFFSIDPKGKVLSVNPYGANNLGYSGEELIGQSVWKVVHKDDLDYVKSRIREILKGKTAKSELEFRKIKKDGTVIFVHEHTQLIFNDDRSIKEILIICRDITSRKEVETILKSEEEKYRTLTNNLNVGIYRSTTDTDGHFIEANPALVNMLGYKDKAELLQVNIADIYADTKGRKEFIDAIKEKGFVKNMEIALLKNDKTKFAGKISTVLIKGNKGKGLYYDGIIEDISNLKYAEKSVQKKNQFLHSIIESLTHPFYVINVDDYTIEIANSAATKTKGERENTCFALIHNNDAPCHKKNETCPITEIRKTGKPFSVEHQHLDKAGKIRFYEVNAFPIFDENHQLKQIIEYTIDITNKKISEKTLKHREEQYKVLFQMAPVGIVMENQDGVIMDANPAYCKSVGYKLEELIGQHVSILAHPENKKEVEENIAAILNGKILKHVKKSINKNGSIVYTELHEKRIELPNGLPAILCFARDITKQKEEQDKLIDQEKKFRDIYHAFPDIYFKSAIGGIVKEISPSVEKITGFSVKEVIGKHSSQFYYSDDDWANIKNAFVENKEIKDFNTRLKTKDGGFVHCSFSARINFDNKHNPVEIEGVLRDITEREKADLEIRKLSRVVEQSPVIVVITDLDGAIEYVNPKFSKVTGYGIEEVVGKNPRILKSGNTDPETYESLWDTITSGKEWYGEFMNKKKNGDLYWESANIFPLKDETGKITHFIAQKEDITARKEMEQDLIDARDKAEESDSLKSAFLANMSHEIRTPMNAIIGFSQLLSEPGNPPDEQNHFIELIQNSGNDLLALINDIIDISKIEAGQVKVFKSDYFIDNVLSELYDVFSGLLKTKGKEEKLVLNYERPKNAGKAIIFTDIERFRQIFTNLLNNAIKFTDSGTIEFGFKIGKDKGNSVFEFYVSDTGIGIEKDKQDIIFNSFRQANDSNTRLYGGTGLGLAITKKIVELLGGDINVISERGKGSTFTFTLPKREENTSKYFTSPKTKINNPLKKNFKWQDKNLLIVEDDDQGFLFFEKVFKNTGIRITRAVSGLEAVNHCKTNSFDIILMDIQLPEMDGLEATRLIKLSKPQTPIIAQTAYALSGEKEICIKAGCDDYISKPINIPGLMEKMEGLLK